MKVVSVKEMREIDQRAQRDFNLSAFDLMSAAGRAIADEIVDAFQPHTIAVLCGKGNNAGDGFVVARRLHERGCEVNVICLEDPAAYQGAARQAWEQLPSKLYKHKTDKLNDWLGDADLLVDALLGTGISGAPRSAYADVIKRINNSGKPIVSIDVPSGLRELNEEEDPGEIVCAAMTMAVGLPKTILLTLPGTQFTGRLTVLPINFPRELLESDEWKLNWALPHDLRNWLPKRVPGSNKGTWGHVGIIGAALEYAGASVMVSRAALRAGCGLATIYTLPEANAIYKISLPEATSVILGDSGDTALSAGAVDAFFKKDHKETILAMGPGLGTSAGAKEFVLGVMHQWKQPLILDADALNILADGWLSAFNGVGECLITPHPGEMARLTKMSVKDVQKDRENVARNFATEHGVTVLLKGSGTLVARPDGQTWLVPGSEAALAKGGTGDVLTGVISGLFAQGMPLWQAAVLGASAHLQAGKKCVKRYGSRGVLATEVADEVPLVLDSL